MHKKHLESLIKNADSGSYSRNSDSVISKWRPEKKTSNKQKVFQMLMSSDHLLKYSGLRGGEEKEKQRSFIRISFDKKKVSFFCRIKEDKK